MPIAQHDDQAVYYEVHGEGFPVLMISGMAATLDWFHYNIPALADQYRVIAQDMRGATRDGIPAAPGPYSTRDVARDSIAVLDRLGIERAHVVALSFGGMIAQWLALEHPERVAAVSIVGNGLARVPEAIRTVAAEHPAEEQSAEPDLQTLLAASFTPDFPERQPEKWDFFVQQIARRPARPATQQAQVAASLEHDTLERLGEVRSDVQLIVGDLDVINAQHAPEMAAALPHCDLRALPGMNHGLNLEFSEIYNDLVLEFLRPRS